MEIEQPPHLEALGSNLSNASNADEGESQQLNNELNNELNKMNEEHPSPSEENPSEKQEKEEMENFNVDLPEEQDISDADEMSSEEEKEEEEKQNEMELEMEPNQNWAALPIGGASHSRPHNVKLEESRYDRCIDSKREVKDYLLKMLTSYPMEYQNIVYFQFTFQMATALFSREDYLNSTNLVFYVGLSLNLLRIICQQLDYSRDKEYIQTFLREVQRRIPHPAYASLFMVLDTLLEPSYLKDSQNKIKNYTNVILQSNKLVEEIVRFYKQEPEQLAKLQEIIENFEAVKTAEMKTINSVLTFEPFVVDNHLYTLRYLGSLYLVLRENNLLKPSEKIQKVVLFAVVKYNMRIFKNIMLLEKWEGHIATARMEVGFEKIVKVSPQEGIDFLTAFVTGNANGKNPAQESKGERNSEVFVKALLEQPQKIKILQDLLGGCHGRDEQILQLLNIFYEHEDEKEMKE